MSWAADNQHGSGLQIKKWAIFFKFIASVLNN